MSVFSFRIKDCCFSKEIMSEILKIGISTLLFQVLTSFSIAMINSAAKDYGSSALAAMGPAIQFLKTFPETIPFYHLRGASACYLWTFRRDKMD